MRHLTLVTTFLFLVHSSFGQKTNTQVEINPFVRHDNYKEFFGWQSGVGGNHLVKSEGLSYGLNISLKKPVSHQLSISFGIGYYKYSFTKLRSRSDLGEADSRLINFPSSLFILFYSDKYWYNTLSINLGLEKTFLLKKNFSLNTGLGIANYFTFSQQYHLTRNPEGSQDYKKKNNGYFGLSANLQTSLLKKIKRISIGPKLIVPLFDNWKTDKTFPNETSSGSRNKWLNGIGLGISFNYSLIKKLK